ncbi:hypothetical protein Gpo141_00005474 [Globisporangium polare]
MNGSDSDEENAMAYFLPNGIANDSPPKRSMLPPGSFGPIGGRTPTAAAGLTGGGFHRSNSPSFLHLNASPGANNASAIATSGGVSATAMAGSVTTATGSSANTSAGSSSSLGGGSFSLADLGGEIHQPRASGYGAVSDLSSTSIGPFGYARAFRSGMQSESENALQSDATTSSIFGRASSTASSLVGNPFSRGLSSSSATTGASYFNNTPSASPFAQENTTATSLPRNWPTPAATTAPATNPRRVFQAPPGLGGPDLDNPARLGLGGDYLASRLMASSDTSGLQQQHSRQMTSSSPFAAYATTTSPAVNDAFRAPGTSSSSVSQFGSSSLSSPLPSLHLTPDVFASSSQLLTTNQQAGITNPALAELNSHSMKMNDDTTSRSAFGYQDPSSVTQQTGSPGVKEIQSMKVDVQARSKTSKPLTASAQPFQYQPSADHLLTAQQQQSSTGQKRMFDKKKQGAFQSEFPPMSPSSYREMLVSPASSGRGAEHHQAKSATASQLRSSATSSPTAAPRSSPAAFSESKSSSRLKKRTDTQSGGGGGLRPNRSGVESYSGGGAASTGADADYESSDSADFGFVSDSGDSPIKTLPDARRVQVREKNDKSSSSSSVSRSAKKERPARSTSTQEKAPVGSAPARRQVYREKQPKEQQQTKPRLKSDILSSDELEIAVLSAKSEQLREGKSRGRRAKETVEIASAASNASTTATSQSTGGKSSRPSPASTSSSTLLERTDSSDLETSRGKKSPKQLNKPSPSTGEKQLAKANVDAKPQSGGAATDSVDSPRAESLKSEKASETQEEKREASEAPSVTTEDAKTVILSEKSDDASAAEAVSECSAQEKKPTVDRIPVAKQRSAAIETPPNEEISPTEPPSQMVGDNASSSTEQPKSSTSEKRHPKEPHRKEKNTSKRDKTSAGDKKKHTGSKQHKKEKRDSPARSKGESFDVSDISDLDNGILETPVVSRLEAVKEFVGKVWSAVLSLILFVTGAFRSAYSYVSSRLNIKGVLGTALYHVESVTAVVFSVLLLLSLHGASWFIRIHRVAFRAILTHRHIGFCFAFLYAFPFLVQYVFPWAPPWAPVCLWYAFLVQLFCTNGPTAMVTTFRILLPLVFLVEGISHHSFLLDLNGAELLLASFIISALKTSNLCSPIFFISLAAQCLSAVFLGSELVVQWFQMALALYSLHSMVASEDDWNGFGDEEEELSCQQSMSMHHSIADYNHHPAPSAASIQKTKRLDRRALAYVRGRKCR